MFDISLYILCTTAGSPERDTELSAVKYVQFALYHERVWYLAQVKSMLMR